MTTDRTFPRPTRQRRLLRLLAPLVAVACTAAVLAAPTAAAPAAERRSDVAQPPGATVFSLASFNLLGAGHTDVPSRARKGFTKSWFRLRWARQILDNNGVDVVGFQELHRAQQNQWIAENSDAWEVYPGNTMSDSNGQNSISWRTSSFRLIEARTVDIPYFHGKPNKMPYVLLEHVRTGARAWFFNVHNPANTFGPAQKYRNQAMIKERNLVNSLRKAYPTTPVFLTGDMNNAASFFCAVVPKTDLVAANGGYGDAKGCKPPANPLIDWVLGTPDARFLTYQALRSARVRKTTDHPVVLTTVSLPPVPVVANGIDRVVVVGVEGLRSSAVGSRFTPRLHRLIGRSASTLNARTNREATCGLPNLVSTLTGRPVRRKNGGHAVMGPLRRGTVHSRAGGYVRSIFDYAHDDSRRTALYSSRSATDALAASWGPRHGARDGVGRDQGRRKISSYVRSRSDAGSVRVARRALGSRPAALTYVHLSDPATVGAKHGYGSARYRTALRRTDSRIGRLASSAGSAPGLKGRTMLIVVGLSGGQGRGCARAGAAANFRVPMVVQGPGVARGANLYSLNPALTSPGSGRATTRSITTASVANLALAALRLPRLSGSRANTAQDLNVFPR